jgi:uncharacterized protein YcfJ
MKRLSQSIVAILGLMLAGFALARNQDSYFDYARVVSVDRVTIPTSEPDRKECGKEPVGTFYPGLSDQRRFPPVVTSDGEVASRTQYFEEDGYTRPTYEERCRERRNAPPPDVFYEVVYDYSNREYHDRIRYEPGSSVRVQVENGYVKIAE